MRQPRSRMVLKLNRAFRTNSLKRICSALDTVIREHGITDVSRAVLVDRVTLYRSFRIRKGPSQSTLFALLEFFGVELIVEPRCAQRDKSSEESEAALMAKQLTRALRSDNPRLLAATFRSCLQAQPNITQFADRTIRSREALYRLFSQQKNPHFSSVVSFIDALGLQLGVRARERDLDR